MVTELIQEAKNLYVEKEFQQALETYETIRNLETDVFDKYCKFNYMWCLFRVKLKDDSAFEGPNENETRLHVKYIIENQTNKDLLYQITVMRVLKHFRNKPNFEASKINIWLDKLNPELLSDKSTSIEKNGKIESYPSVKEEWYAIKTKALEKLECYHDCIRLSQEALNTFQDFHYSNDIWFKRRIAISKNKLGDSEGALEILNELLRYKHDWFIFQDIGEIFLEKGDLDSALEYYVDSIMKAGDDDKKINAILEISEILNKLNRTEDSMVFKDYSIKLRIQNGWKINRELEDYYHTRQQYIDGESISKLRKNAISICERIKYESSSLESGEIIKILENGKAGFIKSGENSLYFKVGEFKGNRSEVKVGRRVQFFVEKSFDIKKNRESIVAVNIKLI